MSKLQKTLVVHGDKILCGALVLYALWNILLALTDLMMDPEVVSKTEETIKKVSNYTPEAPEVKIKKYVTVHGNLNTWDVEGKSKRRSLFYKKEKVNEDEAIEQYQKSLGDHEHKHEIIPKGDGTKQCIFPGCKNQIIAPKVFVGLCDDLKVDETSVMTIRLKWSEPKIYKKAIISYCLLQKRLPSKDETWQYVKDDEGSSLRIQGSAEVTNINDGSDIDSDQPPEDAPPAAGGGFLGLIDQGDGGADPDAVNAAVVKRGPLSFAYYDFNLLAGTKYEYRVMVVGTHTQTGDEVKGEWSEPLVATTEDDRGITFTRYIPGFRDKDAKIIEKNGKPISPDKVYIKISKQFSPLWSPRKYFVYYDFKTNVPGVVGKKVSGYGVKTEDGVRVYYRKVGNAFKFMYLGGEKDSEEGGVYTEEDIKGRSRVWQEYKITKDFTTDWYCDKVHEEIETQKMIEQYTDKSGEIKSRTIEKKKYRYFLMVTDKTTKKQERFELQREKHDKRLWRLRR